MTASDAGKVDVQHLCKLAGVSRITVTVHLIGDTAPCGWLEKVRRVN
jgi:hypothetical protein